MFLRLAQALLQVQSSKMSIFAAIVYDEFGCRFVLSGLDLIIIENIADFLRNQYSSTVHDTALVLIQDHKLFAIFLQRFRANDSAIHRQQRRMLL